MPSPQNSESHSSRNDTGQDALALLAADHLRVAELFDEFETALEEESEEEILDLAQEICEELEMHTELEEEIFYPALAEHAELAALVQQAQREHDEMTETMESIRDAGSNRSQLEALMLRLQEDVDEHVREEENVLFPQVEESLEDELDELGERLARRRQELSGEID
jgi:iron-sulfur cluster repair protein YtfE (RIC family)